MYFSFFHKFHQPKLDEQTSSQMLENIFDACNVAHNSIPLSVLTSYSNYRRERFFLQRFLLLLIILLFCSMPLLFVLPKMQLAPSNSAAFPDKKVYELTVESILPVTQVTANVNGKRIPVYETAKKTYSIEAPMNGTLTVTATLPNRQSASTSCEITGIDTQLPVVRSSKIIHGQLWVYLSDEGSGIDYDHITAADLNGTPVTLSFSKRPAENCIVFDYPATSLNLCIPDRAGNVLQLLLTVQE